MLTFPPLDKRERQRPLPRNLLRRPSVSEAVAAAQLLRERDNEDRKTGSSQTTPAACLNMGQPLWFKDGLLWRRRPAMRRH